MLCCPPALLRCCTMRPSILVAALSSLLLLSLSPAVYVSSLDNGLALTPPMGWLSWERYRCDIDCVNDPDNCISERLYRTMALHLQSDGFLDAGYEYVNIDDCWSELMRDFDTDQIVPDKQRFPSGMRALADYVHGLGLKLGIYGDWGTTTCGGYPGTLGYMQIDAQTFANWTIDSLKLDGCNADLSTYKVRQTYTHSLTHYAHSATLTLRVFCHRLCVFPVRLSQRVPGSECDWSSHPVRLLVASLLPGQRHVRPDRVGPAAAVLQLLAELQRHQRRLGQHH